MSDFEEQVKNYAEKAILKLISSGNWIEPDYNNRVKVPKDIINQAWSFVDRDAIAKQMSKRIEEELANRIINHMAAEISTDVKKILSDKDRRDRLREIAIKHLDYIIGKDK